MLVGLRGIGKTVLLDQMRRDAEAGRIHTARLEAPENRSLPALLGPALRLTLLRLSQTEAAKDYAIRGLRALAGFAGKLKVTYADIEVGLDYDPEPGLADNRRSRRGPEQLSIPTFRITKLINQSLLEAAIGGICRK